MTQKEHTRLKELYDKEIQKNVSLNNSIYALQMEFNAFKNQTMQEEAERINEKTKSTKELNKWIEKYEQAEERTHQLLVNLSDKGLSLEKIKKEHESASQRIHDKNKQLSQMKSEINTLKNQLNEYEYSKARIKELEAHVLKLEENITAAEIANDPELIKSLQYELRERTNEVKALNERLKLMENKTTEMKTTFTRLNTENAKLKNSPRYTEREVELILYLNDEVFERMASIDEEVISGLVNNGYRDDYVGWIKKINKLNKNNKSGWL